MYALDHHDLTNQKSIAVLPFKNISADAENEYFADGMTEEIINALSKIEKLKVSARTSSFVYKGKDMDVRQVGNDLGVSTVLEGSIRTHKNSVRISAQLIRTDNGFHLWSENFDRTLDNIFALQDEISLLIADKIRENFGHLEIRDSLVHYSTANIEAYQLYLKGRYNHLKWDLEGIQNGIRFYQESIDTDPNFSLPYFGIGFCYAMYGSWGRRADLLALAKTHLRRGFALNERSDLGYFARATLSFWGEWDFRSGEEYYLKALEINPSNSEAKEGLAELYLALGEFEKAQALTESALEINPLSVNHLFTFGNIHYLQRNFEEALSYFNAGLEINPNFEHLISYKQLCLIHLGEYQKLAALLAVPTNKKDEKECLALLKLLHPQAPIEMKRRQITEIAEKRESVGLIAWQLYLYTHLGRVEEAFRILDKALLNKEGQYINFKHLPLLSVLHSEEAFLKLVTRTFEPRSLPPFQTSKTKGSNSWVKKELMEAAEVEAARTRLFEQMESQEIFLNPLLSLRETAERIALSPNKLSWLLNDKIGKSFNDFINTHRLQAFQAKALDPKNSHLTLLGLAYESGFNSKSVFNDFFKKSTGVSPKVWLRNHKNK